MADNLKLIELSPEELENVGGGKSDWSQSCGAKINPNCFWCVWQKHGVFTFTENGQPVTRDIIGCGNIAYTTCPYGSINNTVHSNRGEPIPIRQ